MSGDYTYRTKSIADLKLWSANGQLNLEPAFQRQSVWTLTDRRKLIESILDRRPVPSIFLYKRDTVGGQKAVYDVIDGKQRIESLMKFMGQGGGFKAEDRFDVKRLRSDGGSEWIDWPNLDSGEKKNFLDTELQVVVIEWDLADVIDLFVRLNSTGKRLTGAEKMNAKWVDSPVLAQAKKIADEFAAYFKQHKIFSTGQMDRMKHVELVAELLVSLHMGGPINKKQELDKIIAGRAWSTADLQASSSRLKRALKSLERVVPKLGQTRLKTSTELYTLVLLFDELRSDGYVLTNATKNELAQQMLINFSLGVDAVSAKVKNAKGANADEALYLEYLNTVRADTDSKKTRKRRAEILSGVLEGIFEPKDASRLFSPEQRRILWHSTAVQKCAASGCKKTLTWADFTIDHIRPHSKGGLTDLRNAQLMCRSHNAAKGAS